MELYSFKSSLIDDRFIPNVWCSYIESMPANVTFTKNKNDVLKSFGLHGDFGEAW